MLLIITLENHVSITFKKKNIKIYQQITNLIPVIDVLSLKGAMIIMISIHRNRKFFVI